MPDIIISGNLNEVLAKLRLMKDIIDKRVAVGYPPKQHDEEWRYETMQDGRVCPTCGPLNGNILRGDYIVSNYPLYASFGVLDVMVHNTTDYHDADICRCFATWLNMHEVLVERLFNELESAVS